MRLPRLYPIVDVGTLTMRGLDMAEVVHGLVAGGAELLQLRHKDGAPQQILHEAALITDILRGSKCLPVMNDRADLALLAGWDALHVGQDDLTPEGACAVFGGSTLVVGISTHSDEQVRAAEAGAADYVAIGPVFSTATKADAEPAVGLDGVRRARALTRKPLVAIGGISRENAASVIEAGADSVAVIGALLQKDESVAAVVQDFLYRLR